ncbi:MAG: rubredoxin-NAD+ reductase [Gallionellaceae bacterium]|nr:MAG: rubredoxin-NAD+ reductase [Gallionellaceae bacterium]
MEPIIVIGSGLAGYSVIRELRKLDREVPVMLLSRDSGDYYSKPMLSNAFAQGKGAAALVQTSVVEMAKQLGITVRSHTEVHGIDVAAKRLTTTQGEPRYSRLVLAIGADPIRIPLQGDAADAVMSVNDIADYAHLREAMQGAKRIAIMGGGLIGCEFANDWAAAGFIVSVIDPGSYPLASLMPQQAGSQLRAPLAAIGVDWRFGTSVSRVDSAATGYTLTLADGSQLQADIVLSAIGLRPRIALAQTAGLAVNRGIKVDTHLRSSDPAIFALGDCAEIEGRVQPFVLPIMHAARALAKTLAGEDTAVVFPAMPVVVKTPTHPVAVLPVARDAVGVWQTLASGNGIKMAFLDAADRISGFVLTGEFAAERSEMTKRVGTPLAATGKADNIVAAESS